MGIGDWGLGTAIPLPERCLKLYDKRKYFFGL